MGMPNKGWISYTFRRNNEKKEEGPKSIHDKPARDILSPFFKSPSLDILTASDNLKKHFGKKKATPPESMPPKVTEEEANNNGTEAPAGLTTRNANNITVLPEESSQQQQQREIAQNDEELSPKPAFFLKRVIKALLLADGLEHIFWNVGLSSDRDFVHTLANWAAYSIWTMLVIGAAGTMGYDTKPLVTGFGLTTFFIGFTIKEIATNVLSGALLVLQRPFRVGWTIKVGAFAGKVLSIDTRYVRLRTDDGKIVLVPSYTVFANPIIIERIPAGKGPEDW